MVQILTSNPLLALMIVVALGAAVGRIPFGPLRLGAAGALFVGLAIGALSPEFGSTMGVVKTLGLVLFVYTVGLAAGSTFLRDLQHQWKLMLLGIGVLLVVGALIVVLGGLTGLTPASLAGTFSGALTATPALAAAQQAAGGDTAVAIGYALAYPVGVIVAIIIVGLTINRAWPAPHDTASLSGSGITNAEVVVERTMSIHDVPGWDDQLLRASYLHRDSVTRVITPHEQLQAGDIVLLVGPPSVLDKAIAVVGHQTESMLTHDRADVDFRRFVISDPRLVGQSIHDVDLPTRFGGVITRVLRGDLDLIAADDLVLQPGDRVLAVVPRQHMDDVASFFGDSERKISEIDPIGFPLGLSLGLLLGLVTVSLPGGDGFSLGTAAGPLVMGMILGGLHRTGPFQWDLPLAANLTIRQLGLLLFLAAVGLASGPAFAASMLSIEGLIMGGLAAGIVILCAVIFLVGGRLLGLSAPRVVGGFAGLVGQPAIVAFATQRSSDERVESAYVALFAVTLIAKIVIAPLIVTLM